MSCYRAACRCRAQTLTYLANVVRPRKISSCWRNLNAWQQAALVLVHLAQR